MLQFSRLLNYLTSDGATRFAEFFNTATSVEAEHFAEWLNSATEDQVQGAARFLNEGRTDDFRELTGPRPPSPAAQPSPTQEDQAVTDAADAPPADTTAEPVAPKPLTPRSAALMVVMAPVGGLAGALLTALVLAIGIGLFEVLLWVAWQAEDRFILHGLLIVLCAVLLPATLLLAWAISGATASALVLGAGTSFEQPAVPSRGCRTVAAVLAGLPAFYAYFFADKLVWALVAGFLLMGTEPTDQAEQRLKQLQSDLAVAVKDMESAAPAAEPAPRTREEKERVVRAADDQYRQESLPLNKAIDKRKWAEHRLTRQEFHHAWLVWAGGGAAFLFAVLASLTMDMNPKTPSSNTTAGARPDRPGTVGDLFADALGNVIQASQSTGDEGRGPGNVGMLIRKLTERGAGPGELRAILIGLGEEGARQLGVTLRTTSESEVDQIADRLLADLRRRKAPAAASGEDQGSSAPGQSGPETGTVVPAPPEPGPNDGTSEAAGCDAEPAPPVSPQEGPEALLRIPCPNCGKVLRVPARHAGKKGRCPACQQTLIVPNAGSQTPGADP